MLRERAQDQSLNYHIRAGAGRDFGRQPRAPRLACGWGRSVGRDIRKIRIKTVGIWHATSTALEDSRLANNSPHAGVGGSKRITIDKTKSRATFVINITFPEDSPQSIKVTLACSSHSVKTH